MTPTAWADLPNAKHIDRILADLKKNPDKWNAAENAAMAAAWYAAMAAEWNAAWSDVWNTARTDARTDTRDAARDAVWDTARGDARDAVWDTARYAERNAAWYAAWYAILVLIACDDCAYLLDEKPEHVQMLALLGNQAALLLYPACVALQKEMA